MSGFDQIEHACRTDVGVRRSHNQDAFALDPASDAERFQSHGHLFLVADGMGGHAVGEKASAKAIRDIPHAYHKHAEKGPAAALRIAFREANAGIYAIGEENPEFRGLGTTATALLLRPEGAWIGHVGDSRAYRIREGVIEQLTFDHSAVWEIARRQNVDPEELQGIRSNVILRSLGPDSEVEIDIEGPHPIHKGDRFLLCSDGLTGPLSDYEIGAVVSALSPEEACDFLVELANLRGGPDNITVCVVAVGKLGLTPPPMAVKPRLINNSKPLVPWPLTCLALGILLAILAIILMVNDYPGGRESFVLATIAIAVGLLGLGMHGPARDVPSRDGEVEGQARVYRMAECQIEKSLIEKLKKAESSLEVRFPDSGFDLSIAAFRKHRKKADQAFEAGDLTASFQEHCRAMHILLRTFNQQRHKEEVFQPVWDKHAPQ